MTVWVCCEVRLARTETGFSFRVLSIEYTGTFSSSKTEKQKAYKLFELRAGYLGGKGQQQFRGLPLVLEKTILKEGARKRKIRYIKVQRG